MFIQAGNGGDEAFWEFEGIERVIRRYLWLIVL